MEKYDSCGIFVMYVKWFDVRMNMVDGGEKFIAVFGVASIAVVVVYFRRKSCTTHNIEVWDCWLTVSTNAKI